MKFMIGYDGSDESRASLELALRHCETFKAGLLIVHSIKQERKLSLKGIKKIEAGLKVIASVCAKRNVSCKTLAHVTNKTAGEDLARLSDEMNIDAVFIGIQKKSKIGKAFFGSTAQYVILNAACPVICTKGI